MKKLSIILLVIVIFNGYMLTMAEESIIGSWECIFYIAEGEMCEINKNEKEMWQFEPNGTWQIHSGNVMDYTFTNTRIVVCYEDPFSDMIGYEKRLLKKEYSYYIDNDELILIYTVNGGSIFLVHHRISGEGLFGRWNQIAVFSEEAYLAYCGEELSEETSIFEFWEFHEDGKCVFWQGSVPETDGINDTPNLNLKYKVNGEKLELEFGQYVYNMRYAFKDGCLLLDYTDHCFIGDNWVNIEKELILQRVSN